MKTIILAAGYATRLYPLTKNFPKSLLTINNKTILDYLIDNISQQSDEFILVSNHKFINYFIDWANTRKENIQLIDDGTVSNETRLGAIKDIQLAVSDKNIEDDIFVTASDNILDFNPTSFLLEGQKNNYSCVMYYEENNLIRQQKTAIITLNKNNIITSCEEKPFYPKSNLSVPPFYYYKKKDIPFILTADNSFDAPGNLITQLYNKIQIKAYLMPGKRYDIGTLENYLQVKDLVFDFNKK